VCKNVLLSPSISPILPSCAEAQMVVMANIDSPYPSSETSSIDLDILTYIDDLALNRYLLVLDFIFYFLNSGVDNSVIQDIIWLGVELIFLCFIPSSFVIYWFLF
jgi:hypothetical protein